MSEVNELRNILLPVFNTNVRFEARFINTILHAPYLCYQNTDKFVILLNNDSIKSVLNIIIGSIYTLKNRSISLLFRHDLGTISSGYPPTSNNTHNGTIHELCIIAEECSAELCIQDHRAFDYSYAKKIYDSHQRNNVGELCLTYPLMPIGLVDMIRKTNNRNRELKPPAITEQTLNIAIALSYLYTIGFGPYVLLEIINWTNPRYHNLHDKVKLRVLQHMFDYMNSMQRLRFSRCAPSHIFAK